MSTDLFYNPTGSDFTGRLPMKTVEKLSYLDSIEDLYRYNGDVSIGVYYPVRILPSASIDLDAEWPIVMPAGCIVSVIPLKDARAYDSDETSSGVRQSGVVYVSVSQIDGTGLEKSINFMYPKDVAGLTVPCNGGTETTDSYVDNDGTYGILTISGAAATASDTHTRPANVPTGIVNHSVYADMRYRYLNYDARQGGVGHTIALDGVITIPYIQVYGSGDRDTVLAAVVTAVNAKHQYLWVQGADEATVDALIAPGDYLMSDTQGRFTNWDESDDHQRFGKIIETRHRVPWNLDEIIDSIPGSGMKGTDTGGLKARTYHFIQEILKQTAVKGTTYAASKANVKQVLYTDLTTDTSNVSIAIGLVDVAFGSLV